MDHVEKSLTALCALLVFGAIPTVCVHGADRDENNSILKGAQEKMQVAASYGKTIDPIMAYKIDTMRRLNKKGTWLTQREVKEVIETQIVDYIKGLPQDRREWSVGQRLVFDYGVLTLREFEKNPDKAKFREQIRQDLKNMGIPQEVDTASSKFERRCLDVTLLRKMPQR